MVENRILMKLEFLCKESQPKKQKFPSLMKKKRSKKYSGIEKVHYHKCYKCQKPVSCWWTHDRNELICGYLCDDCCQKAFAGMRGI